ncbi:MAG TPA: rRNA adenine N-6-methyltransferase family protein [Acidimicrobiia bacterium]|nr:rRNA adenine N-6-methyltransferase family protein [Acidimicrobiia bacterium]
MPGNGRAAWGWHRLTDDWAHEIVAAANVRRGELVLDIGAGDGALTRPLLDTGARVIAIEIHPGRLQTLRRRFADEPRCTVVRADAADLYLPRRPFRVVANPPFHVSSALLRRLTARGSRLVAADLVLQRAVAQKWAAGGSLRPLPRAAFSPRPRVDAAVLILRR